MTTNTKIAYWLHDRAAEMIDGDDDTFPDALRALVKRLLLEEKVAAAEPAERKPVAGPDGLFHDRAHIDKPEARPARSVRVKPRKPVASWAEEADGDTWALEIGAITAFVIEDCDGVRADIEVTGNDPITGTFQHNRKAAQLAAEDALRAIADQIYAALRGGV